MSSDAGVDQNEVDRAHSGEEGVLLVFELAMLRRRAMRRATKRRRSSHQADASGAFLLLCCFCLQSEGPLAAN